MDRTDTRNQVDHILAVDHGDSIVYNSIGVHYLMAFRHGPLCHKRWKSVLEIAPLIYISELTQ